MLYSYSASITKTTSQPCAHDNVGEICIYHRRIGRTLEMAASFIECTRKDKNNISTIDVKLKFEPQAHNVFLGAFDVRRMSNYYINREAYFERAHALL